MPTKTKTENVSRETKAAPELMPIAVKYIQPNPNQPRQNFDSDALAELAESIREHGILQPPVVRRMGSSYQLIAGERRVRAAGIAGLETVLCVVRDADTRESAQLAIVENRDRRDIDPIEEAKAYKNLIDNFGAKVAEVGAQAGKSRSVISNSMRLLQLPESVQEMIADGRLSVGHGRALLPWLDFPDVLHTLARYVADNPTPTKTLEAGMGKWDWKILGALKKANAVIPLPWNRDVEFDQCDNCPFGAMRKTENGEAMCLKIDHYRELATARKKRLDSEKAERQKAAPANTRSDELSSKERQAQREAEREARRANNAQLRDEILERFAYLRRTVPANAFDNVHALLALSASAMMTGYGMDYYENLCEALGLGKCSLVDNHRDSVRKWFEAMDSLDLLLMISWRQVEHSVSQFGDGELGARMLELLPEPREEAIAQGGDS